MVKVTPTIDALYQPLNEAEAEVRLLALPQSDPGDGEISASFRTVSLNASPTFYALSYVWGDPSMTRPLKVDGSEVFITPNLERILRSLLRHKDGPACLRGQHIWIDALCINQKDVLEKEHQIPLMGRIYGQATRVLMWLGDGDDHSDWVMARMKDADFYSAASQLSKSSRTPKEDEIKAGLILYRNLEERVYWSRVWIMQELVLPRNDPLVFCGDHYITWSHYVNFLQWLPTSGSEFPEMEEVWARLKAEIPFPRGATRASIMHRILREAYWELGADAMTLKDLLGFMGTLSAGNPRDFVFGMLGMVRSRDARLIQVNYSRTPAQVFTDVFSILWQARDENPLEVYHTLSVHQTAGSPAGLPSWVPDLTGQATPEVTRDQTNKTLRANRPWKSPSRVDATVRDKVLHLKGIRFDEIDEVEKAAFNYGWRSTMEYDEPFEQMIAPLRTAESMAERGRRRALDKSDMPALHQKLHEAQEPPWKTLSYWAEEAPALPTVPANDQVHENASNHEKSYVGFLYAHKERVKLAKLDYGDDQSGSSVDMERALLWEILLGRQAIPEVWASTVPEEARKDESTLRAAILNRLFHAIRKRIETRTVFLTNGGFLGVGTTFVEKGDMLILVVGMTCPLILRPFRDGYHLVGFAWVSGLMDWNVLDEALDKFPLPPEDIKVY